MKTKHFFLMSAVIVAALVMCACNGVAPSNPNLYVEHEEGREVSQIYYVSYVKVGADGHSGKNIVRDCKGEYTFKGKKYLMFSIPKGTWDIYMEWPTDKRYTGMQNLRETVNSRDNDWIRFDYDMTSVDYRVRQGSGEMY